MPSELKNLLTDPNYEWTTRLVRLQGWRGDQVDQALAAGWARSLAPAVCGVGAIVGGLWGSPVLLGLLGITSVVGTFAANHPLEAVYNWAAPRVGRVPLPRNRAAKRLGCLIGTGHLFGAAAAFVMGATVLGLVLSLSLGVLASFVALSGLCVPSMLFSALFGVERATCPSLIDVWTVGPNSECLSGPANLDRLG